MVKSVWQKVRRIAILEVNDQALFMTKRISNPEMQFCASQKFENWFSWLDRKLTIESLLK